MHLFQYKLFINKYRYIFKQGSIMKITQLVESKTEIVYRGLNQEFDSTHHAKSNIIFCTPSLELAQAYSNNQDHVYKFEVRLDHGFNFGFRTLSTEVQWKDITGRLQRGIMTAYTDGLVDKQTAHDYFDAIYELNFSGFRKVWMWYMDIPVICDILRGVGYDHIVGLEGIDNSTIAYGVLYPDRLIKI